MGGSHLLRALSSVTKIQTYGGHKKGKMLQLTGIYWANAFMLGVPTHAFKGCQFSTKYSFVFLTWSCFLWLRSPSFWNPLAVSGIPRCGFSRINSHWLRDFWRFFKDVFLVSLFLWSRCKTDGEQV